MTSTTLRAAIGFGIFVAAPLTAAAAILSASPAAYAASACSSSPSSQQTTPCPADQNSLASIGYSSLLRANHISASAPIAPNSLPEVNGIPCTGKNTGKCIGLQLLQQATVAPPQ